MLPLGFTTWLAAAASEQRESWALRVLIANATGVLTLPLAVIVFMRHSEYYTAPLFLTGVLLTFVISLLMTIATVSLLLRQRRGGDR